ncbi:MAG: FAD-dependent monooxygenase [Anaerolineae bacterium]|nr:FAD-dependent monooxygenase [Anaerolineae bacterium]
MYDAIIVGARCAGSAVAMLLARQGFRILLLDRATFPSDTLSGHFIFYPGVQQLSRWGLLESIIASGCPPITSFSTNLGDFTLRGTVEPIDGVPGAIGPRRTILDTILVEAAAQAGAEVRTGFTVTDVIWDGDQVTGIRGHVQHGQPVTEHAAIIIGADGKHSRIAQLVDAPTTQEVPPLTCLYYSYWSDFPCDGFELNWRPRRLTLTFPTNDGLTFQAIEWPRAEFQALRSGLETNYLDTLTMMPDLRERLAGARRASIIYGTGDTPNCFRKRFGPGWALVGDAAHVKDPTPAQGISDAFADADVLAEKLGRAFSGELPIETALTRYETERNQRALPEYERTCQMAHLEGWNAPDVLALRAALRDNPAGTSAFFSTFTQMIPPETFFSPDNISRIMQQAAMTDPL